MTRRKTILITNIWLTEWAGSEVVVRDLALGLLARGHRPIVYSPRLGAFSDIIAARGVAVIDDLRKLAEPPDIIHAHHCIPCGEALIRFPGVPAIQVCHAFHNWIEAPAHFPQIAAYVAVDEACRDRLVHAEGIDPQRVVLLHNGVDLSRIPPRSAALKDWPQRAVAFGKAGGVPELRSTCERLGIAFDVIGATSGDMTAVPEQELVHCDLVFASARCALEALCCGCAVIVCDTRGLAGLVTSRNFVALRATNFGLRSLSRDVTVERLMKEIDSYDVNDAIQVSRRARAEADLTKLLDQYENLYDEALSGPRRPDVTPQMQQRAVSEFLHAYLPRVPGDVRWPWLQERQELQRQIAAYEQNLSELGDRLEQVGVEHDEVQGELDRTRSELKGLKRSRMLKVGRLLRKIAGRPDLD